MKTIVAIIVTSMLLGVHAAERSSGAYLGAQSSEVPHWFKDSFLEFEQDVAEAATNDRRVMLYFHQHGCPYCAKLVDENFTDAEIEAFVRRHFDGIEINMWGDREIVSVGGNTFSEKTFAAALKVQYTPTIIFLNEQGKAALRLNGYYPPQEFQLALRYVAEKQDASQSFSEYLLAQAKPRDGALIDEDFFIDVVDLADNRRHSDRYLAVYFEAPDCARCETLHRRVLSDPPTRELARQMDAVQLDIYSSNPLVAPDGTATTHRDYARQLNIAYTPSVVFLDQNAREVHRVDGFMKTFHFQSSLAYVLEQGYAREPSFQRYIAARGERLRAMGYDTDIWGYRSFHPPEANQQK